MSRQNARSWKELLRDRQVLSWALYDWANSAFATTILAGFFPVFFKKFWSAGADVNLSTFQLGMANSASSAVLAFLSPVLGAIADQGSSKKKFLIAFSGLGIVMTGAMAWVARGEWQTATLIFVVASIGFAGGNTFYDALLVSISRPREMNAISALGFSLGYLGGGVLFAINVLMTLKPHLFGLRDATTAVQLSFVTVAIWWAVFSLPLFFFVREPSPTAVQPRPGFLQTAWQGVRQVVFTFREVRGLRNVSIFLAAYFFYIDGVNTIIRMAVDYGLSLGFPSESLIVALLITQFVGFPAAILFNHGAQKWGAKNALFTAIAIYVGVNIFAFFMHSPEQFYILAIVIGLVQGGLQSLSRSVFGQMIPPDKAGEFFGFFNMLGKFSSMVGPVLVGVVSQTTQSSRMSILSILLLFIVGALLLSRAQVSTDPA